MAKTAQKKTAEELIKKSAIALGNKKLVEVVKNAPLTKDRKVNLTKVHDQAFEYVFSETKDLKIAKDSATSARWLAMLGRDYPEDFYKTAEIATKKLQNILQTTIESKPEPILNKKIEINLRSGIDIIIKTTCFRENNYGLRFSAGGSNGSLALAGDVLRAITGVSFDPMVESNTAYSIRIDDDGCKNFIIANFSALRDYLIQILEEKFGMKIKVCGNCKGYSDYKRCLTRRLDFELNEFYDCAMWTPKEILEEKK